jgi:hypothetical protein
MRRDASLGSRPCYHTLNSGSAAFLTVLVLCSCRETVAPPKHATPVSIASAPRLESPTSAASCLEQPSWGPASGLAWPTPAEAPPTSLTSTSGAIAGRLNYPGHGIRRQLVYALSTWGPAYGAYSTETVSGQGSYTIKGVAPGTYFVYSTPRPVACSQGASTPGDYAAGNVYGAAYTEFAKCGLGPACGPHTLLSVSVQSNATTSGIDVLDWYGGTYYPAPPAAIVPSHPPTKFEEPPFASAREAAIAITLVSDVALLQDTLATCPVNRACMSIGEQHDGTEAAYFEGASGSNADVLACGAYVYKDSSGWRGLRRRCRVGSVFPAIGQSGTTWSGFADPTCVNARSSPGSNGKVVVCLTPGTSVRVDGGPAYVPMASIWGVWWHVAGRGWMADEYLYG